MKIIKIIFFMVISLALLLTGCSQNSSNNDQTKGGSTEESNNKLDFPKKDITLIVPWNAGGGNDINSRELQNILQKEGINVVVKNVPGGNGVVGITEVVTSKPDGYTLGVHTSSTLSVIAQGEASLDSNSLTNIALISEDPHVLVVNSDSPWESIDDFVKHMQDNPNEVSIATPGTNNVNHAVAAALGEKINVEFKHIPFEGGALVLTQLMGGHVDAAVLKPSEVVEHIEQGTLKAIALNSDERAEVLPEVPTFVEAGYDLFETGVIKQISFIVGPAGMDPSVTDRLREIFKNASQSEQYQSYAKEYGFIVPDKSVDEFDKEVKSLLDSLTEAFSTIFK